MTERLRTGARRLWWLLGACPAGFRSVALVGTLLVVLGVGQLGALTARTSAYPGAALALALLLLGGGLALRALVLLNLQLGHVPHKLRRRSRSRPDATTSGPQGRSPSRWPAWLPRPKLQPSTLLTGCAGVLLVGLLLRLAGEEGARPLRVLLLWRPGDWAAPAAVPDALVAPLLTLLEGSLLLALGAVAVCSLCGLAWVASLVMPGPTWLRAGLRAGLRAVLGLFGRLPYLVPALLARLWLCGDVSLRAAEHWVSYKPGFGESFYSFRGVEAGLLVAALFLGLQAGDGLLKWLDGVRAAERGTDSQRLAQVLGTPGWRALLRDGVWLRRRRDLSGLLLATGAWALLLDMLSSGLIDAFGRGTFPLYPSLGSVSFLGLSLGQGPLAALAGSGQLGADGLHVVAVGAACMLLVAAQLPQLRPLPKLHEGALRVAGRRLVSGGVPPLRVLATTRDHAVLWVLGTSGTGKTSLLRAWAAGCPGCVLVPQDPDLALPAGVALGGLLRTALPDPEARAELGGLLEHLSDERLARRLDEPFLPAHWLSRGERQRLAFALGLLAAARRSGRLLLDEFSSGQDRNRTARMVAALRRRLKPPGASSASSPTLSQLGIASHDPEVLDALTNWASESQGLQGGDEVLWLARGGAARYVARRRSPSQGTPRLGWEAATTFAEAPTLRSEAVTQFLDCLEQMLSARDAGAAPGPPQPAAPAALEAAAEGTPRAAPPALRRTLLPAKLAIPAGPLALRLARPMVALGSGLHLLVGPSGSGKSTLLWHLALHPPAACPVGLVPQDPARAFPGETVFFEALRPALPRPHMVSLAANAGGAAVERDLVATLRESVRERFGSGFGDHLWRQPVQELSEGMRQRLLFVREPLRLGAVPSAHGRRLELLLLDEPFGSVDPVNHRDMLASVLAWLGAARHRAAILVSHRPEYDELQARLHNQAVDRGELPGQGVVPVVRWGLSISSEGA